MDIQEVKKTKSEGTYVYVSARIPKEYKKWIDDNNINFTKMVKKAIEGFMK